MFHDLVLIHRRAIEGDFKTAGPHTTQNWFLLKTCMRLILVGPRDELSHWDAKEEDQVFEGEKAYKFILEVISGLHSSLLGETEILGQFKNATANFRIPASQFGLEFKKLVQSLLEDVKKVRAQFLGDLGSQSYGSILRKEIKKLGETQIHIIGAGHLCEEILPWIAKDGVEIHMHVRDVKKAQRKFQDHKIEWHIWSENTEVGGVIVVAAPVGSDELATVVNRNSQVKKLFDMRSDSDTVDLQVSCDKASLKNFSNLLSKNIEMIRERKAQAVAAIEQFARIRGQVIENRPFGWEDMTA